MRWSLLLLGVFLVVSLPLYPSVDGARIRRDDGNTKSLLERLFNAIMGGDDSLDNDDDGVGDNDDDSLSNSTSTLNLTTTTTTTTTEESLTNVTNATESEGSISTEAISTTQNLITGSTQTTGNPECERSNDLATYCAMSDDFETFMQWDTSSAHLVSKVFSETVINQLLTMCQPGSWCLGDDFIQSFGRNMVNFFNGPICNAGLQDCIADILSERADCSDILKLSVLSDSLSLLCKMEDIAGEVTPECFGHTIATLHVTMADEIRATSKEIQFGDEFCLGAYVGMTRKFMCTLEECPNHQKLFTDFVPWHWFMNDAVAIKEICQLQQVCGDKELAEAKETTTLSSTFFSTSTSKSTTARIMGESVTEPPRLEQTTKENNKPVFILQASDDSTRLMIGVVTGTLIGVLVLMLLIGALVKSMRRKFNYSTKDGYSKLHNNEFD